MSRYLTAIASSLFLCSQIAFAQPAFDPNDRRGGYQGNYNNGYDNRQYDPNRGDYRPRGYQEGHQGGYRSNQYARDGRVYGDCRHDQDNRQATNAAIGAAAGGLFGNQVAGRGSRTGGTIAGVLLGAVAGYALSNDVDCADRSYAEPTYSRALEGRVGQRYDWRNDQDRDYGYFTPTREYDQDNYTCRDWVSTTYRDGRRLRRSGSACRYEDGNWHFQ